MSNWKYNKENNYFYLENINGINISLCIFVEFRGNITFYRCSIYEKDDLYDSSFKTLNRAKKEGIKFIKKYIRKQVRKLDNFGEIK